MINPATSVAPATELEALAALNDRYIRASLEAEVRLLDDLLAEDFLCANPDGTMVGRDEFIWRAQAAVPYASMMVDDVRIRVLGDVAVIHGRTAFSLRNGMSGSGRYTDVWANRDGRWVVISSHITQSAE